MTIKSLSGSKTPVRRNAFTLAEMMVVMLILSIVMAAFAPVMTTRNKTAKDSPWRYVAAGGSDAYYGTGAAQTAMIGQSKAGLTDNAKLVINVTDTLNAKGHILLKRNNDRLGRIFIKGTNLIFGNSFQNITGTENTSIGIDALTSNTSGSGNTAIGFRALQTINSSDNVAIGRNAMRGSTSSGSNNVAIGSSAMLGGEGTSNIAIGTSAMTTARGSGNIAIGINALRTVSGAGNNIAIGSSAMGNGTVIGDSSIAIGASALLNNTVSNNIAMGTSALRNNTSGGANIAIGVSALTTNTTGDSNTAIGHNSLLSNSGSSNTATGASSLGNNTTGNFNTATGTSSLKSNTTGYNNTAIGYSSLESNTTGYWNTATGFNSLNLNKTGNFNTATGLNSLNANTGGSYNTATGVSSLNSNSTGSHNTAIGYNACQYVTGSYKTCIGAGSGPGSGSGSVSTNTDNVIFIGTESSTVYIPGNLIVGKETVLGAQYKISGNPYKVWLKAGNHAFNSKWTYIGTDDYKGGDDNLYAVNDNNATTAAIVIDTFKMTSDGFTVSDSRLKNVSGENKSSLDKIKELKVFNYTFKKDEKKTPHVGVMAQDLQKIFPDAVIKGEDGYLQIRMEDMFYALVNAVKELDLKVEGIITEIKNNYKILKQVQDDMVQLKKENKQLKEDNKALEARLLKLEQKLK